MQVVPFDDGDAREDDGSDSDDLPSIPSDEGGDELEDGEAESGAEQDGSGDGKGASSRRGQRTEAFADEARSALGAWHERPEPKSVPDLTDKKYPCYDLRWFLGCCICYPPEDAVILGDVELVIAAVKRLKKRFPEDWRARLNQRHDNYGGHTLTALAILESNFEIAEWLIDNGIDIDQRDKTSGLAPLHHAVRMECLTDEFAAVINQLLEAGVEVDVREKKGMTPLMLAALFGHVELCKLLIEFGADIEGRDKEGWRPLNYASYGGRADAAQHLVVEEGVDVTLNDKRSTTAERLSSFMHEFEGRRMRHGAVVSFLEAYEPGMTK